MRSLPDWLIFHSCFLFIDTCDHEQKNKIDVTEAISKKYFIPLIVCVRSSSYWHVNFRVFTFKFKFKLQSEMYRFFNVNRKQYAYTIRVHSPHLSAAAVTSKWLNSNRTNIELLIWCFFLWCCLHLVWKRIAAFL